ncbi:MAG: hypothetical protein QXL10_03915 [Candidatus Bathyarchaeia archaeon]
METIIRPNMTQQWSIFSALHDAIRDKELKKLRFAHCSNCQLYTPYRLKFVSGNKVQCKKCGSTIHLKTRC